MRTLDRVWETETGQPTRHLSVGGGTCARELPMAVAFGGLFPGDQGRMHAPEETISVGPLLQMAALYAAALEALAAPEA